MELSSMAVDYFTKPRPRPEYGEYCFLYDAEPELFGCTGIAAIPEIPEGSLNRLASTFEVLGGESATAIVSADEFIQGLYLPHGITTAGHSPASFGPNFFPSRNPVNVLNIPTLIGQTGILPLGYRNQLGRRQEMENQFQIKLLMVVSTSLETTENEITIIEDGVYSVTVPIFGNPPDNHDKFDRARESALSLYRAPWNLSDHEPRKPSKLQLEVVLRGLSLLEKFNIREPSVTILEDGTYSIYWHTQRKDYVSIDYEDDGTCYWAVATDDGVTGGKFQLGEALPNEVLKTLRT